MIAPFSIPLVSLVYPLVISAAVWAIAVWALKQSDPLSPVVKALTGASCQEPGDEKKSGHRSPLDQPRLEHAHFEMTRQT